MKLIFLDIDGTLTEPGSNVPPFSAMEAVKEARKNGHKVFLCTGRNLGMAKPVYDLGFDGIVSLAGGYVLAEDTVLFDEAMPEEDSKELVRLLHEGSVYCTLECLRDTYADSNLGDVLGGEAKGNSELERWRKTLMDNLSMKTIREYDGSPVYKIVIMLEDLRGLDKARESYEDRYNFVLQDARPGNTVYNGELIMRSHDKGLAVRLVAEHYGVPIADTVGFGDSMNDLEMIEAVGTSVAMGNGSDLIKEKSDLIAPSVSEDGMMKAFQILHII